MLENFGLHLTDILLSFKIDRIKFVGDSRVFKETFGNRGDFDDVFHYLIGTTATSDTVSSMEIFLTEGSDTNDGVVTVSTPSCEYNVQSEIRPLSITWNGDKYTIYSMTLVLKNGDVIEYGSSKRTYYLHHGTMADGVWVSANKSGTFANRLHVDIDQLTFPDLTISASSKTYCNGNLGLPTITWNGSMQLNVLGEFTVNATRDISIHSGTTAVLGRGTRGISVSSSGSTTITL
jgi:hypothetical protein